MSDLPQPLSALLVKALKTWRAMSPEEQKAMLDEQRASWVRGQIGLGSDTDEAAFREEVRKRAGEITEEEWANARRLQQGKDAT